MTLDLDRLRAALDARHSASTEEEQEVAGAGLMAALRSEIPEGRTA